MGSSKPRDSQPPLLYKPLLNIQSHNPLKTRVHDILGGHFVSSPLGLVKKAGGPGNFRIVRDLSYHDRDGYAVNDHLDSDDFPTLNGAHVPKSPKL
jgi:hypothetical protein